MTSRCEDIHKHSVKEQSSVIHIIKQYGLAQKPIQLVSVTSSYNCQTAKERKLSFITSSSAVLHMEGTTQGSTEPLESALLHNRWWCHLFCSALS
jgi:hypothetical protein